MSNLWADYRVPSELQHFVDSGFLEVLTEKPAEKAVEFHIPRLRYVNAQDRTTAFTLIWIHPEFNSQFCHFYDETPGDVANFYVIQQTEDGPEEHIDLETFDDLISW